ncbi:MAG: histidine kinase [Gemmatimonadota bacterium]
MIVSPEGPLAALREGGALFAITPEGAEPLTGPEGRPLEDIRDAAFDREGGLWILRGEKVWNRSSEGRWKIADIFPAPRERPVLVRPHMGGQVHVATTHGVWRVGSREAPERLLNQPLDVVDILTTGDGRVLAVTFLGRVLELTERGPREIFRSDRVGAAGRAISIVERGTTLWLAIDRYLVGWQPGRPPVVLGEDDDLKSGGPLLVDHEGSLWMGSFVGLYQLPEPDTVIWTERSGLPSNHVRYVARTGNTIWLTTWQGAGYLRQGPNGWQAERVTGWTPTQLCVDSRNVLWAGSVDGLVEVYDRRIVDRPFAGSVSLYDCHESRDGALWLGTDRGLLLVDPVRSRVRPISTPFQESPPTIDAVVVDHDGELWIASGEAVCRTSEGRLRSEGVSPWTCDSIAGAVHVSGGGLIQTSTGALWASSNRVGVLRREADGWKPVPGVGRFPSRSILSLVPSPSGGIWLVGHGVLRRVVEAPRDSSGWRIEERLSYWHGLPGASGTHVFEETDGALWITTSQGLAHIASEGRFAVAEPPSVVLVDARVDDEPVVLASGLDLPHHRNRLDLRFTALSFRDPLLLRYQVRLSPDDPWLDTTGLPHFRWVDLAPGGYRAEVRASLDGKTWSATPAAFAFRVGPPWYREPWAITLFLGLGFLTLYGAYRLRLDHLLELERQRTRIAMDLHDEIGSGLGSIGILSGILTTNGLDPHEGRRMVREIAATTGELSAALSQIVWTLDSKARTMEEVAGRLAELGRRLFAGETIEFTTRFPDRWPGVRPSQIVRRNVVLIGLEALHNVARHSRAHLVELFLLPGEDGSWELDVVDNGVGLQDDATSGVGLRSMRRRAEEIGAELTWSGQNERGTKVSLVFWPRRSSPPMSQRAWRAVLSRDRS